MKFIKFCGKIVNWLIYAIFIVPKSQIKIFDLPYQFYTFDVFHMHTANRWSHFIGIPLNLIALYCIFLPNYIFPALVVLLVVLTHHVVISIKYKLYGFVSVLISCHFILWSLSQYLFEPFIFNNEVWYFNPIFHFLFWPFVQYITHSLESYIPKPWSRSGDWSKLSEVLRESKWYILLLLIVMIPFHTFVELISSWRNLYIEILGFAHKAGYNTPRLQAITQWIATEKSTDSPLYNYEEFKMLFLPYYKKYF